MKIRKDLSFSYGRYVDLKTDSFTRPFLVANRTTNSWRISEFIGQRVRFAFKVSNIPAAYRIDVTLE